MQTTATPAAMSAIAAAVTPVVMISANAILIGTISAKHQAMSDRVRGLTAEWRNAGIDTERRDSIRRQIRLFNRRILWLGRAHVLLYFATAVFIGMVLAIALRLEVLSLPLLVAGAGTTLIAIFLELGDLARARTTLAIESRDILEK